MIVYDKLYKKYGFSNSQLKILELIGSGKKVLEIGSSTGYMTKALKEQSCIIDVIEIDLKAAGKVKKFARKVINDSVENPGTLALLSKDYDFIIMADVLEHLVNPEFALNNLVKVASQFTQLIISVPNIASWPMRKQLFFKGDFNYEESGLLDKTHLHFYTVNSLPKFLESNGWRITEMIGTITVLPFEKKISKLPLAGLIFDKLIKPVIANQFKNFSFYHFVTVAGKR